MERRQLGRALAGVKTCVKIIVKIDFICRTSIYLYIYRMMDIHSPYKCYNIRQKYQIRHRMVLYGIGSIVIYKYDIVRCWYDTDVVQNWSTASYS